MKIKQNLIGAKVKSTFLDKWVTIEEDLYVSMGLIDIFEEESPKIKKNAKNRKKSDELTDSDSDGASDIDSSPLAL
jgi:hypothetical protein